MKTHYPLLIIGAGPAGMAAAAKAAALGLEVALLDEQNQPGGQIYRNIQNSPLPDPSVLGPDYARGKTLAEDLSNSSIDYQPNTTVWMLNENREVGVMKNGQCHFIQAERIIIASGAMERPFPIPGWHMPGVMTAGAAQVLFKSAAVVPDESVVLAGTGPLLLLIAWQYLQAGVKIDALLNTTPRSNYKTALPHLPAALRAPEYLFKGLRFIIALKKAGIRIINNIERLEALGQDRLQTVRYVREGQKASIDTSLLLLHQGVAPNNQLAAAAGCDLRWNEQQLCWQPVLDDWGNSNIPGIAIAGDSSGIIGAIGSQIMGRLCALEAAQSLQIISSEQRNAQANKDQAALQHHQRIRPFLDALYRPVQHFRQPEDTTLVCRCEEVTAGEIRQAVAQGGMGPNQVKSFTRCGMGPCQGRMCGLTVCELIAEARQVPVAEVGYYRIRPPIKPIALGVLADVSKGKTAL